MIFAYRLAGTALERLDAGSDLAGAVWIDLYRPQPDQVDRVAALGYAVPSLSDMQEIEISNRLYHDEGCSVMTVMLPGSEPDGTKMVGPVTFIVSDRQLVTVRHHEPRPFATFPTRAGQASKTCTDAPSVFVGLAEEMVGRLADLLEEVGVSLDSAMQAAGGGQSGAADLSLALDAAGRQGELLGRVRLAILTMSRAMIFYGVELEGAKRAGMLKGHVKALQRDLQSLDVHADFLDARLSLITDLTLGMVNLAQGQAVKSLSVVAAVFLPPTLIASIYGMNFAWMPFLDAANGFWVATGMMIASVLVTYLLFRWFKWL